MRWARAVWMACVLAVLAAGSGGRAQLAGPGTPPATTEDALHAMAQQAAVIFAGQVVGVRRVSAADGATGVVEIEFAVDDAVRGVSGSTYTLREWSGLWTGGDQPFLAGRRYLMLLHAPSAAGLSSPVGGMDGAIPIRGGPAAVEPGRGVSTPADGRMVDLRWVATRVVRPVRYVEAAHPTALPGTAHVEASGASPALEAEESGSAPANAGMAAAVPASLQTSAAIVPGTHAAGYAAVLALLRSWETSGDAAR